MIDVHAHLCFGEYDRDMESVVARCREELSAVVIGTARYDEGTRALALAARHPGFLFTTLGYHPVEGGGGWEKVIGLIKENADKISGIGEVGLDYHWEKDSKKHEIQKEIFSEFIRLAARLNKPVVIHSWDAEEECFDMVKDAGVAAVFHCFSGSRELARRIASEGFFVSVSTMVLFSKNVRKIAKDVPLDRLLLETDSPFLSPNKEQDPRNYPWNIKLSAKKIAELKKTEAGDVLAKAKENAVRVFGIET